MRTDYPSARAMRRSGDVRLSVGGRSLSGGAGLLRRRLPGRERRLAGGVRALVEQDGEAALVEHGDLQLHRFVVLGSGVVADHDEGGLLGNGTGDLRSPALQG